MLHVDGITYSRRGQRILDDIRFHLRPGELVALLGMNGSGKSTLLKALCGLIRPEQGEVRVEGAVVASMPGGERARRIGYLPQKASPIACTVFEAVLLGRTPHLGWRPTARDMAVVERVLALLDLERLAMRFTTALSGGEFQKVAIARALAQEPRVLLLDEPINHLDIRNQLEIMTLLGRVTSELGLATLTVLHDLGVALRHADRLLLFKDGGLHSWGDPSILTSVAIRDVFGMEARLVECEGIPVVLPVAMS